MSIRARARIKADAAAARVRFLTAPANGPDAGKPFGQWKATRDSRGRPLRQQGPSQSRQRTRAQAPAERVRKAAAQQARPYHLSRGYAPVTTGSQLDRGMERLGYGRPPAQRDQQDRASRWRAASAELARRYPYPGSSRDAREGRQPR